MFFLYQNFNNFNVLNKSLGASSVARGYSGYIDQLTDNSISSALHDAMPMSIKGLSPYPDFLAFSLVVVLSGKIYFYIPLYDKPIISISYTLKNLILN